MMSFRLFTGMYLLPPMINSFVDVSLVMLKLLTSQISDDMQIDSFSTIQKGSQCILINRGLKGYGFQGYAIATIAILFQPSIVVANAIFSPELLTMVKLH